MLEDTQSLAAESGSLARENTQRIADVATLKAEIAALRAEVSVPGNRCSDERLRHVAASVARGLDHTFSRPRRDRERRWSRQACARDREPIRNTAT